MLLTRCLAGLLLLGLMGQEFASAKSKGKMPVSLKEKWRGRCKDIMKKVFRRNQYIDDGCYRYKCVRKGRYVAWSRSDLSSECCFLGSKGYPNDSVVSNTTTGEGCFQKVQVCAIEGEQPVIETRVTPLCCQVMGKRYPVGNAIESDMCSKMRCEMTEMGPGVIIDVEELTTPQQEHSTHIISTTQGSTEETNESSISTGTMSSTTTQDKTSTINIPATYSETMQTEKATTRLTETMPTTEMTTTTNPPTTMLTCLTDKQIPCVFPFKEGIHHL